jgi:lipoprotein-releasing system permease protein
MHLGDFTSINQIGNAIIGQTLADDLGVKLGDKVEVTFPRAKTTELTVAGIFNTGTPLGDNIAFVSLGL